MRGQPSQGGEHPPMETCRGPLLGIHQAGDWAAGERGLAAQAARKGDFEAALQQAAEYVKPCLERRGGGVGVRWIGGGMGGSGISDVILLLFKQGYLLKQMVREFSCVVMACALDQVPPVQGIKFFLSRYSLEASSKLQVWMSHALHVSGRQALM